MDLYLTEGQQVAAAASARAALAAFRKLGESASDEDVLQGVVGVQWLCQYFAAV